MADKNYSSAMKNAEASVRMEGLKVTSEMQEQCQRVLDGKLTTADALMQLLNERERQNLRNALASTHIGGLQSNGADGKGLRPADVRRGVSRGYCYRNSEAT